MKFNIAKFYLNFFHADDDNILGILAYFFAGVITSLLLSVLLSLWILPYTVYCTIKVIKI